MSNITKILAPDGSEIYIQYGEEENEKLRAVGVSKEDISGRTKKFMEELPKTIRGYSTMVLNAVQEGITGQIAPEKVTLAFGLQIGGEAGIPFITKGTAQANVTVNIEWNLKKG
ncbi:MAG: CU044_2847 family protein [Candidatus Loosdrechtia sp.]|uniref:CU044_2847 family protein n=1 Tax=Candidatus Loosdrechtia sp. TaxID=3101272 RepID=UPI003A6845ED|nr:MAG: CU044_2847 family protein [Candidatus Jettenia sp. AMX2]